jgi:selenocysteine lyase/cysteine desulfurase
LKAELVGRGIHCSVALREHAQFDFADKAVDWRLRLSPHYYNTDDEVDRVVEVLSGPAR